MRTTVVLLIMLMISAKGAIAEIACDDPFFQAKEFELEELHDTVGNIQFFMDADLFSVFDEVEINAHCRDSQRFVDAGKTKTVEFFAEHFADKKVRQYVVKFCGQDLGFIKIERRSNHYKQPLISLTDTFDRIIAEIASADNEDKQFVIRDTQSQIVARGRLMENGRWQINATSLSPLLTGLLFTAARLERNSCDNGFDFWGAMKTTAWVASTIVLGAGGVALFRCLRRT